MNKERRERLPVSVSAAVFIENNKGELLLLQQAAEWKENKWGPPAGGAHAHEDPRMTALREAEEEIGLRVMLIGLIGVYTVDRGDVAAGIGFVFKGRITEGEIKTKPGEIMNHGFFNRENTKIN